MAYEVLVLHGGDKAKMKVATASLKCPEMNLRFVHFKQPDDALPSAICHLVVIRTEHMESLMLKHKKMMSKSEDAQQTDSGVLQKVSESGSVLCLFGVCGRFPVLSSKGQDVVYYTASQFTPTTRAEILEGLRKKHGNV